MKTLLLLALIFIVCHGYASGQAGKPVLQVARDSLYPRGQRTDIAQLRLRPPRFLQVAWIMWDPYPRDLPKEFGKKEFRKSLKKMIDYLPVSEEE